MKKKPSRNPAPVGSAYWRSLLDAQNEEFECLLASSHACDQFLADFAYAARMGTLLDLSLRERYVRVFTVCTYQRERERERVKERERENEETRRERETQMAERFAPVSTFFFSL